MELSCRQLKKVTVFFLSHADVWMLQQDFQDNTEFTSSLFSSVQFSHSVVSNSLWPHELQHTRPPCLTPTPGAHPNSCSLSQRCHPIISSSVIPFSSCPQSFPASGSFQMSQLLASGGQSIGVSASTSVLPMNIQGWFPLDLLAVQGTLKSLLQHHSSKASILWRSVYFMVWLSHPYMTTGKTIALTRWTFVGKVMSLLFNSTPRLPPNKGRSPHLASPGCPLLLLAPAPQASQVTSLISCLLPVSPSLTPPHLLGLLAGSWECQVVTSNWFPLPGVLFLRVYDLHQAAPSPPSDLHPYAISWGRWYPAHTSTYPIPHLLTTWRWCYTGRWGGGEGIYDSCPWT